MTDETTTLTFEVTLEPDTAKTHERLTDAIGQALKQDLQQSVEDTVEKRILALRMNENELKEQLQ